MLKERDDVEVALAIRSILRGGAPIDPFVAREILKQISIPTISGTVEQNRPAADQETLTQREQEILSLVAQGLSNREIAEQLCVSRYTVESHIKHIYRKLSVSKRTKAVSTHGIWEFCNVICLFQKQQTAATEMDRCFCPVQLALLVL